MDYLGLSDHDITTNTTVYRHSPYTPHRDYGRIETPNYRRKVTGESTPVSRASLRRTQAETKHVIPIRI